MLIFYKFYNKSGYFTFNTKKYLFIKTVYIKIFIIYIKRVRKYINYKRPTENIKEKGPELLVNENIILINTPPINYNNIFTYYKRRRKLINCNYAKEISEFIRFKIIKLINFFICS